jgi:hypothetical protein
MMNGCYLNALAEATISLIQSKVVNTDPVKFESHMAHLKAEGCKVVAMRDLGKYVAAKK